MHAECIFVKYRWSVC